MPTPHRPILTAVLAAAMTAPLAADYPIVSHRYLADPAAMVHEGRVYLYCSNDDDNSVDGGYNMKSIVCVSSDDLKNWTDHGEVLRVPTQAAWAAHAWAPAAVTRHGKVYLYFANNASSIGVVSGPTPIGPFTDPRGSPLISSATPGVLPAPNIWIFDPSVLIDDDGQAYLYFGGNGESNVRIIRLNEDMISISGTAIAMTAPNFFEAAWVHKRRGLYYFSYSTTTAAGLRIDYLSGPGPTSGFTYRGIVAGQPPSNNNNNHAAQFELHGRWYHVYHNRAVALQAGIPPVYRRNIAIEELDYQEDGTIRQITYTTDGLAQARPLDPFTRVEAETTNAQSGIETRPCDEGGMELHAIDSGDWIRVRGVDFGSRGAASFEARVAGAAGGTIELRLDHQAGTLVGTCTVAPTDGSGSWATASCTVSGAIGQHDLYLVFRGSGSDLFSFNWWRFIEAPTPPAITAPPRSLTLAPGRRLTLWVEATGTPPLHYRWLKDGAVLPGATGRFFEIDSASASDAGSYVVEVANAAGAVTSGPATVAIEAGTTAHLGNMSVRTSLPSGTIVIPGFVLSGDTTQPLLTRAIGPSLARFEVANPHTDPAMTLYSAAVPQWTNDNWGGAANAPAIAAASLTFGAFTLATDSLDAAMLLDLAPGSYTAHVSGVGASSGVVLFELYNAASTTSRLVNISARAFVGTGENIMIPGFTISGHGAMTVLIRAVGPSLARFQVPGLLADPTLTIFQGQAPILTIDDWGQAPDPTALRAAQSAVHAFALEEGSADAAVLVPLMPGAYTVQARGAASSTGTVLVEVYEVP